MSGPASRTHLLLYRLLAGAWYGSVAVLFVLLPVLIVAGLNAGDRPALVVWALATLLILALSARARGKVEPPGRVLTREEAPRLHALVDEVRRTAGIGPVGEIRLTGTPNVGVTSVFRGTILTTRPVKVLLLGLPYLRTFTVPELESILLHEFAHFVGQDVKRGEGLAIIEARVKGLLDAFDRSGILKWGNPVYLWVRIYASAFARTTARIRRRQEALADALAAEACGPLTYSRALLKAASVRRIFFRVSARRVTVASREGGALPANLFLEFRRGIRAMAPAERRRALREAREAPEPHLSTHPPLAERLASLGRLHVPRRRAREERASNLVPVLEAVEEEMTPAATRLVVAAMVVKARRLGLRSLPTGAERTLIAPAPARAAASVAPMLPLLLPS